MFDLGRSFLAAVERRPNAIAISDGDLKKSYEAWFSDIQRAAHGLERLGLKKGDHLVAVMQNRWQMATLHWACQFSGIIMTPLNWRSSADELAWCTNDAEARVVIHDDSAQEAVAGCGRSTWQCVSVGQPGNDNAISFEELCAETPSEIILRADPEDWSLMLYTSGTTSRPKGVPRRHRAERAAAVAHLAQNMYSQEECTLGVMPLYHTMGVRSLLSMALLDGHFVCVPKFDVEATLDAIEREKITNLYLVPTLYHMLIEHSAFSPERVASVTKLGFAGASMSDGLLQRVEAAFKPELFVNHYGSSEIYTFTIDQKASAKPGSSGRSALNQRIRVVALGSESPDDLCKHNEEGQIIADLSSDEAFEGYWKRPDADAKSIHEGWYFTSDTGFFDEDGDLFVTGRVDDLIITGGENVSPAEIENALSLHPAVEEVAVVGLPDEQWGKLVVAFIKLRHPITEEELDAHCVSSGLARFKRPRRYEFIDQIPKSPVGKILRRVLVTDYGHPTSAN
ncbi:MULTISPECIES: AMP-binding protein [Halomonadaceae]|jgi:2-furoate---CoA ligase|uniref:4-chlorobenzoate--CoA ligase n=1 Tax=Vreelandella titanicae TaxID=664683 RepID=A0A653QF70_9GAMM|nr:MULTISPECIES: AMP-binding protein [Halomonas]QKS23169.1 4-chlorobenzoate--CoA ligase [Halomonas titanicae]CAD5261834.1 AMP-dependent synthetase and ligase [Halomonas sp. 156]CAD5287156.1 AMP-dependent synthetase and ligase [Halomonas sp. 113]CAD5288699.1 AMP-dependent synthetase and ligase [Halomonas sp. 59]CAD5291693.1 AMP-dependent synthetase and ligase [Halomonas sp. I3]